MSLDIRFYKLKSGQTQISYWHPVKKKRVRNKFKNFAEAKKASLVISQGLSRLALETGQYLVFDLVELHLKDYPDSKLISRKKNFLSFSATFGRSVLADLTKPNLLKWLRIIQNENNYTERNMIRIQSNFNFFFKWLVEERYLTENPLSKIRFKRNQPPKRDRVILSEEEIKDMLGKVSLYCPSMLFPFIYTLIHTGARRNEVMTLRWENVDFATQLINFRKTKNGEDRRIKMSKHLFKFLLSHPKYCDFVFTNQYGEHLGRGKMQRLLKGFHTRFPEQKQWRCHDLRHSFAYNFLLKGGEMYQLKAILGHKTIQLTVDLYGNLKAVDIKDPSPFDF